jgi:hypothetical protein
MQVLRQILDAEQVAPFIDMPQDMRHGRVAITVISVHEAPPKLVMQKTNRAALEKIWKITKGHANPTIIPLEKHAWALAVADNAARGKYEPKL